MDINLHNLPNVIYACFVLHNYCKARKENLDPRIEHKGIQHEKDSQPATELNRYLTDTNDEGGKRVRRILTKYIDP